jgi:hypothetical protein
MLLGWRRTSPVAAFTMRLIVDGYHVLNEVAVYDDVIFVHGQSEAEDFDESAD